MNILSLVKGFIAALIALPQILGLIRDVKSAIRNLKSEAEREKALAEFSLAAKEAKKTGDTSKLETLYGNYVKNH